VICCVDRKVRHRDLDRELEMVPRYLDVTMGGLAIQLRTDVVEMSPLLPKLGSIAGPGDAITTVNANATIGIALTHPVHGPVVTTAGHLVFSQGQVGEQTFSPSDAPAVSLLNGGAGQVMRGRVLRVVVNDTADYALVKLDGAPHENLYKDSLQILGIHTPSGADLLGKRLFVLGHDEPRLARFLGYRGVMSVGNAGTMRNLIVTELATSPGDSGACLVDDTWNAWGLLLGGTVADGIAYSVFTSVLVPVVLESAPLV